MQTGFPSARSPAPFQGSWLGYAAASGLEAIDFRITDAWIDPVSEPGAFQCESLIRLPNTQWTYRPPPAVPDVSPLPAESRGQITFGAAINLAKLNVATIEMWSGVLLRMPSSTLVLKATNLSDAPTRQYFIDLFARCGIDQSRVILENSSPLHEYLHWFAGVDIILDTFPFSGGTTTCHCAVHGRAGRHAHGKPAGFASWLEHSAQCGAG